MAAADRPVIFATVTDWKRLVANELARPAAWTRREAIDRPLLRASVRAINASGEPVRSVVFRWVMQPPFWWLPLVFQISPE